MPQQAISLNPTLPNRALHRAAFVSAGILASLLMLSPTLHSTRMLTFLETAQCAGICAAIALAGIAFRGPRRMSARPAGRIALAGFFAAAVTTLDPIFRYTFFDTNLSVLGVLIQSAVVLPCVGAVILWVAALNTPADAAPLCSASARLEAFLRAKETRTHLIVVALLAFPALTFLSGIPLRSAFAPAAVACALIVACDALFKLAATPWGARVLLGAPLLATGWVAANGARPYLDLRRESAQALAMMDSNRPEEAKKAYDRAVKLSSDLRLNRPLIELDSAVARRFEAQNNPGAALQHWIKVATLLKADHETFPPLQRVRCELGESLPVWRKLVYEGFPAIDNPEMAPGVTRLGEIASDARAKLLTALLAWNRNAPEAERRALLEAVQKSAPMEPTSLNLLARLGVPFPDAPMWLPNESPNELLVGATANIHGIQGALEDLGEASTIVCLNTGHWEMSLRASGTPMHEEWPIVRVELNGQPLATTQVNKAVDHDVPFTFDVTHDDIFRLRIVFLNHKEDLEEGHAARRGLKVKGIKFTRAKD